MSKRIQNHLNILLEVLKDELPDHTTSVSIFFNGKEIRMTQRSKTLDQILTSKNPIINLKGEEIG